MTQSRTKPAARILLIEDDPTLGPAMLQRLRLEGFDPRLAVDGASAIREACARRPDAVLSDMKLPDQSGEEVYRAISAAIGLVPYVFVTAFGEVQQAVRLVKAGARDYLIKPVDVDALVDLLSALTSQRDAPVPKPLEQPLSLSMRVFEAALAKAARSDLVLLLSGETGVGKERAARQAHHMSTRAAGPFVPVNCAAIPRDLAESLLFGHEKGAFTGAATRMQGLAAEADGGTLFLDEIAELPLDLQPKLLRLLQEKTFRPVGSASERRFGGRVMAATHRHLKARVADGMFREDLYFRLAVIELTIPPLRERSDEILSLAHQFLREVAGQDHIVMDEEACDLLRRHQWPGNIRELRNRIERAAALREKDVLSPADIFPDQQSVPALRAANADASLEDVADAAVRRRIKETLVKTAGNQSEAARLLGVSRTTIWKYARET
jgi:DNA-binding NtrC family response regulator